MAKLCPLKHRTNLIDGKPVSEFLPCIGSSCEWYDDEYQRCAIKSILKNVDSIDVSVNGLDQAINDVETAVSNLEKF